MANGIDFTALLGEGGFGQATRGFQSPTNPQGVPVDQPWWKNANLMASVLGQVGEAIGGPLGPAGGTTAGMAQSNIMEMAREKKEGENQQMMQYMIGLLGGGGGGFTPADQPGPTKLTADANKMSLDMTPDAISSDELGQSGFNAPTPARQVSGFNVPTADMKVSDLQKILPFQ